MCMLGLTTQSRKTVDLTSAVIDTDKKGWPQNVDKETGCTLTAFPKDISGKFSGRKTCKKRRYTRHWDRQLMYHLSLLWKISYYEKHSDYDKIIGNS